MPCPVPHFAEDHDLRDQLAYAFTRSMDQPDHPTVNEAYGQALIGLRMILEDGCPRCVRETVKLLNRCCGWPKNRDICLLMIKDRIAKVQVH